MSNLQIIERLCRMLENAASVIREQAEILAQHGIETGDGGLEAAREKLLEDIEKSI